MVRPRSMKAATGSARGSPARDRRVSHCPSDREPLSRLGSREVTLFALEGPAELDEVQRGLPPSPRPVPPTTHPRAHPEAGLL